MRFLSFGVVQAETIIETPIETVSKNTMTPVRV